VVLVDSHSPAESNDGRSRLVLEIGEYLTRSITNEVRAEWPAIVMAEGYVNQDAAVVLIQRAAESAVARIVERIEVSKPPGGSYLTIVQ